MKCDKCGQDISDETKNEFNGRALCEDCYMDTLSPPRACDPWAVYSAKSFGDSNAGSVSLNEVQSGILSLLKENGDTSPDEIAARLQLKTGDVEREIATLRHMEKIRGALVNGRRIIRLW